MRRAAYRVGLELGAEFERERVLAEALREADE
jgi:hypothetical protein